MRMAQHVATARLCDCASRAARLGNKRAPRGCDPAEMWLSTINPNDGHARSGCKGHNRKRLCGASSESSGRSLRPCSRSRARPTRIPSETSRSTICRASSSVTAAYRCATCSTWPRSRRSRSIDRSMRTERRRTMALARWAAGHAAAIAPQLVLTIDGRPVAAGRLRIVDPAAPRRRRPSNAVLHGDVPGAADGRRAPLRLS